MGSFGDDIAGHIFSGDPAATFTYEDSNVRKRTLVVDPALRRLMLAVLEDAVGCFQSHLFRPSRVNEARFREAIEWIASDVDHIFSFNNVCENLGIDAGWFRKEIFRWRENKLEKGNEIARPLLPKKGRWRQAPKETRRRKYNFAL